MNVDSIKVSEAMSVAMNEVTEARLTFSFHIFCLVELNQPVVMVCMNHLVHCNISKYNYYYLIEYSIVNTI